MEVFRAGNPVTTGDDAEPRILDALEAVDGRLLGVGKPDRSPKVKLRADERLVRNQERLFVLSPRSARKGFEDLETVSSFAGHRANMRGEREQWIQGYAEDFRVFLQRQKLVPDRDLWVIMKLVSRSDDMFALSSAFRFVSSSWILFLRCETRASNLGG